MASFDRHGTPRGRPLQVGSAALVGATLAVAHCRYPDGLGSIGMGRHEGVPYKSVPRALVGATLAVAHCRYPDGLGSIGMGRLKGVPYKSVPRRS